MREKQKVVKLRDMRWLKYVITAAVLAVLSVLIAWLQGAFSQVNQQTLALYKMTESQYRLLKWGNAISISGVLTVLFGLMVIFKNTVILDKLVQGIFKLIQLFKQDRVDLKYRNFAGHRKALREKRLTLWYIVIVGCVFVAVGALLGWCLEVQV